MLFTSLIWLCFSLCAILAQNDEDCSGENQVCYKGTKDKTGIPWHEFDWKSYIGLDWKPEIDEADPWTRFGIHLKNSIDIGVNRTIPDNRYVVQRV